MSEAKRNVCRIFVDGNIKVPMIAKVEVIEKADFEKIRAIGEEKIVAVIKSGLFFEITLTLMSINNVFDNAESFDLTIDYGHKTEKYKNCIVTGKQGFVDSNESFWKQKIVIASMEKE